MNDLGDKEQHFKNTKNIKWISSPVILNQRSSETTLLKATSTVRLKSQRQILALATSTSTSLCEGQKICPYIPAVLSNSENIYHIHVLKRQGCSRQITESKMYLIYRQKFSNKTAF